MKKYYLTIPLVIATVLLILPFVIYSGNEIMRITSDSMIPIIYPNDVIIVKKITIEEVQEGDIIVFDLYRHGLDIIAHRVFAIGEDEQGKLGVDTKGDNVEQPDSWTVYEENLIGVVVDVVPLLGFLLIEPVRFTLVAVIIITAISMMWEFYQEQKNSPKTN